MTSEEIKQRVQEIRDKKGDPEAAHSLEIELYVDFVRYVAELHSPISLKALEVLQTKEIQFSRWCA